MEHLSTFALARNVSGSTSLLLTPVRRGVLSWNTTAPCGRLRFRLLRAHVPDSQWYDYAQWDRGGRQSFSAASDRDGLHVDIDVIAAEQPFDGIEVRADDVRFDLVAFASPQAPLASRDYARAALALDVPAYSQYVVDGERGWCSPTSLAMVHAYHGVRASIETTARAVFDRAYNGTGNWAFNVAYSGQQGLRAMVAYLRDFEHARRFIERKLPLVISYSWSDGELPGAPLAHSDGHLAVLCGFTASGDCVINDPAAAHVNVIYPRDALERLWLRNDGVAYVIAPAATDFGDTLW
jgi:hypothetical protein